MLFLVLIKSLEFTNIEKLLKNMINVQFNHSLCIYSTILFYYIIDFGLLMSSGCSAHLRFSNDDMKSDMLSNFII